MVSLNTLFPNVSSDLEISGLGLDSRTVKQGFLFAALPGQTVDGRKFIDKAVEAGAAAILVPTGSALQAKDAIIIEDDLPRKAFAKACANFYGKQPETCAAVTGTNGKSSCVTFIKELWEGLGHSSASVGTIGIFAKDLEIAGKLTTPDPVILHQNIAKLVDHGVTHMAMEASSHGLDQYRLDGVKVQIAAFTNLSRDHLDYHADMEEYFQAKARLFSEVLIKEGKAVLNADIPEYQALKEICEKRGIEILSYGQHGETIKLINVEIAGPVQNLELSVQDQTFEASLPLAGGFQVENALCSLGIVIANGADVAKAVELLSKLSPVPGRMEHVGANVYVDYAHTPDALETVINALRPHTKGRLMVLFGCGGDRDQGKRPQMGAIAEQFADFAIVTDDNPRSENPDLIRKQIMDACPSALEIADRKKAIHKAIDEMKTGDLLILAGKGHETGQIVGDQVLPFDDREIAKDYLENSGGAV